MIGRLAAWRSRIVGVALTLAALGLPAMAHAQTPTAPEAAPAPRVEAARDSVQPRMVAVKAPAPRLALSPGAPGSIKAGSQAPMLAPIEPKTASTLRTALLLSLMACLPS